MAIWWLSEAAPLPATALLPILILPLTRVCSPEQAAAPFADPLIFVFLGGFVIGKALEVSGLHQRLALALLLLIGTTPRRMVGAVMLATAIISMFVSNTATAMMMLPLGMSIVAIVDARSRGTGADGDGGWDAKCVSNFAAAMLLGIAYAASIGGMGTPIGTPPNLAMTGYLSKLPGDEAVRIGFGQWMIVAMPVLLLVLPVAWGVLILMLPVRATGIPGGRAMVRAEFRRIGGMSVAERVVLVVFSVAVGLWIFRQPLVDGLGLTFRFAGKERELLTDAAIAIGGALLLLVIPIVREKRGEPRQPVISWEQAETLPWGTLLMFGGGLSLAAAIGTSGLDIILGNGLKSLGGMPHWVMVPLLCLAIVLIGELTSNVALATLLMPILHVAAKPLGVPSTELLMMATLSCSMGFMLPVATPPNAIVFATGRIGMGRMIRCGLVMDVVSVAVIAGVLGAFGPMLARWAGLG
jgi:sodium-dependent dicarboxylate transporter 2/3/5